MKKVKTKWLICLLACLVVAGGISAYLTASDVALNTFTVQKVDIELVEPNYIDNTKITPNETVPKDPMIINKGNVEPFVFLSVKVPYKNIITADPDGTKKEAADTELFFYEINDGWVEVGEPIKDEVQGVVEHIYAYGSADTMTALAIDGQTPTLFDEVTMCNAVEGQGLENTMLNIVVDSYAIQSEDIGESGNGTKNPEEVLKICLNSMTNEEKCTMYYDSLSSSVLDLNNGELGLNSTSSKDNAEIGVFTKDNKAFLVLLKDAEINETVTITSDATLDLNGHEIKTAVTPAIRTQSNEVTINGSSEGSAITVNAPAGAKGTVLSAMSGTLNVNGGTYTANTAGAGTSTNQTQVIYAYTGTTLNVKNAVVTATDSNNGCVIGVNGLGDSSLNLTNCDITVTSGKSLENIGVKAKGDAVLTGCNVVAKADYVANAAGTTYASNSRGVYAEGSLKLYDCYVWGAHSGVISKGNVYVDGGVYEGYGHGSFYIAGSNTTSYFYNAELNWAPMLEGTVADTVAGTNGAGFYIGNGAKNVVTYFDNCDFNMNEANGQLYKGSAVPFYGLVFRTSGGESNNTAYLSNCYVEMAKTVMFRGAGSSKHTVYNGVGNDWSKAAKVHTTNSTYFIDTTDSYAKN